MKLQIENIKSYVACGMLGASFDQGLYSYHIWFHREGDKRHQLRDGVLYRKLKGDTAPKSGDVKQLDATAKVNQPMIAQLVAAVDLEETEREHAEQEEERRQADARQQEASDALEHLRGRVLDIHQALKVLVVQAQVAVERMAQNGVGSNESALRDAIKQAEAVV